MKQDPEEIKKQVKRIEYLAKRLPWIAVLGTVIIMLITLVQVLWR